MIQLSKPLALASRSTLFKVGSSAPGWAVLGLMPDRALCDENLRWLRAVLAETEPTMWAAWGTLIEKRDYLPGLMREMVALTRERDIPWVTFGKRSKKGHPHHPLYLRKDSTPEPFDVENYLDTCF